MSEGNEEFGLIRSFGIDNGELDGLTPQEVFVLGYELAQVDYRIDQEPKAFSMLIHAENINRIFSKLKDAGRISKIRWQPNDISESWAMLEVECRD